MSVSKDKTEYAHFPFDFHQTDLFPAAMASPYPFAMALGLLSLALMPHTTTAGRRLSQQGGPASEASDDPGQGEWVDGRATWFEVSSGGGGKAAPRLAALCRSPGKGPLSRTARPTSPYLNPLY